MKYILLQQFERFFFLKNVSKLSTITTRKILVFQSYFIKRIYKTYKMMSKQAWNFFLNMVFNILSPSYDASLVQTLIQFLICDQSQDAVKRVSMVMIDSCSEEAFSKPFKGIVHKTGKDCSFDLYLQLDDERKPEPYQPWK